MTCLPMPYYVYILANRTRTIYTGVTSNLEGRIAQHKSKAQVGFTQKYDTTKLVYYEEHATALEAIAREKQVKAYRREKKVALINALNPKWQDLAEDWEPNAHEEDD
ncbi:MAG: GIY-YIG nuclease family protein [Anaerolineales bacterium]|nr:GIY-YIG nuclease family protein [Anaerolineales bacterium]